MTCRRSFFKSGVYVVCIALSVIAAVTAAASATFNSIVPLTQGFPFDRPSNSRVAYNSKHNQFLIVYEYHNDLLPDLYEVHATIRSANGQFISFFKLGDPTKRNLRPDVCYDSVNDQYMVTWQSLTPGSISNNYTMAQRIPWSGYDSGLTPLKAISHSFPPASEEIFEPRVAFNTINRDFMVVTPSRKTASSKISLTGVRINSVNGQFTGTGSPDFTFSGNYSKARMHPEIIYNPAANEYFVVYDDYADIWSVRLGGVTGQIISMELAIARWGGTEIFPSLSYLPSSDVYMIAWTGRATPTATYQVYYRLFNRQGLPTDAAVLFSNDPPNDNFSPSVLCTTSGETCSILWAVNNNNGLYMMEKTFNPLSSTYSKQRTLQFLGLTSAFQPSFLGIGGAAGSNNLFISYAGFDNRNIQLLFGRGGLFSFLNPGIFLLL